MPSHSILLIKDEAGLQDVLSDCLGELEGWELWSSEPIHVSIELCKNEHPNVVLTDASISGNNAILLVE